MRHASDADIENNPSDGRSLAALLIDLWPVSVLSGIITNLKDHFVEDVADRKAPLVGDPTEIGPPGVKRLGHPERHEGCTRLVWKSMLKEGMESLV